MYNSNNGYSKDRIIEMPNTRQRDQPPDDQLARALEFTPQDLAANRAGWLSETQRQRLEALRRRALIRVSGLGVVLVAIVIGWIVALQWLNTLDQLLLLAAFTVLLLALGALMSVTMQVFQWWQALRIDIRLEEVRAAGGLVLVKQDRDNYTLTIERKTFKIDRATALAFRHLEAYIVYYAPQTQTIVTAEPSER